MRQPVLVLRIHNQYQYPGGEDAVFEKEVKLLRSSGHVVSELIVTNDSIGQRISTGDKLRLAAQTIWSRDGRRLVAEAIDRFEPAIIHFDNTLPLISPAAYEIAKEKGVAVVQTLHNYRAVCPSATLYRDGRVCEDCLGKTPPYPGTIHGCYRGSRAQTTAVGAMLTFHRLRRTWSRDVDRYIALSSFARSKFIEGGLPAGLLVVKPNFTDPVKEPRAPDAGHMLFVGRLSPEKGIASLLSAASRLPSCGIRVAGDGPMAETLSQFVGSASSVTWLGHLDQSAVTHEMLSARALIFPSEWYEGMPMTILQAFACGLPVIASRLGAMAEMIGDGVTGLLFEPGDAEDLATKLRWAQSHPVQMHEMGRNARREYEAKYTPERNYQLLMDIYQHAIDHATGSRP